ncbi:MAG TPA: hypothetical protein VLY24_22675 [Bryobacteraceae bacterium]|nr:hypothetical protein [Bryobacteraceae bacterium]
MQFRLRFFNCLLAGVFISLYPLDSVAQQQTPGVAGTPVSGEQQPASATTPTDQPSNPQSTGAAHSNEKEGNQNQHGTSKDRLFFALPNFLTLENAGQVPPLTAGRKFKVTARSSFDYVQYFWYGALAGISQWENSEPGFGQGGAGYGKRFGSYFADGTIENFATSAILPALLHQDPRYFQKGTGGFWRRAGYAVGHVFVTRGDSGHKEFNFSEILGSASASAISTYSYHPVADRDVSNALSVWGSQVGYDTLTFVVKEFWPDIRRKIHHQETGQLPTSALK